MILPHIILASSIAAHQPRYSSFVYGPPTSEHVRYSWGLTDEPSEGNPDDRMIAAVVFVDDLGDGSGLVYGPAPQAIPYTGDRKSAIAANDAHVMALNSGCNCLDFNGNGIVDSQDFYDFVSAFYSQGAP